VLQAVRHVGHEEERVRIREIVVNRVTLRDGTVVPQRVEIVVSRANATFGFQQAGSHELECRDARQSNQRSG